VAVAAGLSLSACGSSDDTAGDNSSGGSGSCKPATLAFMAALTGDSAALGQDALNGVNTAVGEFNDANPDCKVDVKTFDSQGDPDQATKLAPSIVGDSSIIGLVGPAFSGESLATGPAFNDAGLPSISQSATNVTITQQGWKYWHRVIANDGAQAPAAAKYITTTAGASKVFVVDDGSDYGKGLADGVRDSLGSADIGNDTITTGQTDFGPTVQKIMSSGADGVYYGGYYTECGLLLKQLRQAGYKGVFGSGDGSHNKAILKIAGDAANDAFFTDAGAPATDAFKTLFAKYNNGEQPGSYSAEAYDATKVFLDGIKSGVSDRESMENYINSYDAQGITKEIKFDSTGEVATQTIYVYKVVNGAFDNGAPIE
jgi:branched-chain amino acid transport system substrate-binding protein